MLDAVEGIIGRATFCKLAVAVQSYHLNGTVHIGFVGYEAFAKVVGLAGFLEDFGFKIGQGRVVPARSRTVLVLDACDRIFLYNREDRFVRILFFCFLCAGAQTDDGEERKCCEFFHS